MQYRKLPLVQVTVYIYDSPGLPLHGDVVSYADTPAMFAAALIEAGGAPHLWPKCQGCPTCRERDWHVIRG